MDKTCSANGCEKSVLARGLCPKHLYRWNKHGKLEIDNGWDRTIEERFWVKVDRSSGCWLWTAGRRGDGYGAFQLAPGKQIGAHRYSYEIHKGEIPNGMVVMHSCDTPLCVNPDHLSLGTSAENAADASRKGRRLPGSQNHQAKLVEDQVIEMRERYASGGITHAVLAEDYGISRALVSAILTRKAWRHI